MPRKHAPITPHLNQFLGLTSTPSWLWGVAYAQQRWEQEHYLPLLTKTSLAAPYIEVEPRNLFTQPIVDGTVLMETNSILHVTNNRGGWGRGFTGALTAALGTWPEQDYRANKSKHKLGEVLMSTLGLGTYDVVYHCCAQDGYQSLYNPVPFNMNAFIHCLRDIVAHQTTEFKEVIHMPRVGAGLGGGEWAEIREVVQRELCENGMPVIVYGIAS